MSIKLPKEADDLLDEIERSNWPQSTKLRLQAVGFRLQNDEADRLREARRDELQVCAAEVFDWCSQLVNHPTTARIWQVLGPKARLLIYWGKYYRGRPLPPTGTAGQARLRVGRIPGLNGNQATPILWYEEQYKWYPPLAHEIRDAEMLVDTVHPRFLKKLYEQLNGPQAWKWVLQDLRHRRPPKK